MQKVQKTYTQEFKREAVRLAQTSGKSITQVAREPGIADSSIHQWRKELAEHRPEAFPGSGHQTAVGRRKSPPQTGTGANPSRTRYSKKTVRAKDALGLMREKRKGRVSQ
jgi:transposase